MPPSSSSSKKTHRQRRERRRLEAQLAALDRRLEHMVSANVVAPLSDVAGYRRRRYRLFSTLQCGLNLTSEEMWDRAVTQNDNLHTLARRA